MPAARALVPAPRPDPPRAGGPTGGPLTAPARARPRRDRRGCMAQSHARALRIEPLNQLLSINITFARSKIAAGGHIGYSAAPHRRPPSSRGGMGSRGERSTRLAPPDTYRPCVARRSIPAFATLTFAAPCRHRAGAISRTFVGSGRFLPPQARTMARRGRAPMPECSARPGFAEALSLAGHHSRRLEVCMHFRRRRRAARARRGVVRTGTRGGLPVIGGRRSGAELKRGNRRERVSPPPVRARKEEAEKPMAA